MIKNPRSFISGALMLVGLTVIFAAMVDGILTLFAATNITLYAAIGLGLVIAGHVLLNWNTTDQEKSLSCMNPENQSHVAIK